MSKIYEILEDCLQGLENGADVDILLDRYPDHAHELRPVLNAAIEARNMAGAVPSADARRRVRAKLMQRAAELREGRVRPRARAIPGFQRLAISFTLVALLLLSGTGLVRASSAALPGENLYPVKRSWEGLRLILTFDEDRRIVLESEFENERLEEVSELIAEGRHETIQFAGVFMEVNGTMYVSGVPILITENTQLPERVLENGAAVMVTGRTNRDGFVEAESITLLPAGTVVPVGSPVEADLELESGDDTNFDPSSQANENEEDSSISNEDESDNSNEDNGDDGDDDGGDTGDENDGAGDDDGSDDESGDDDHSGSGGGGGGGDDDDEDGGGGDDDD
jgi:hypothetical protein